MKIGLIGAGKVGTALGKYFSEGGLAVTGYYSRTPDHAKQAAEFTNTRFYPHLEQVILESDALFLTVPDRYIAEVFAEVRRTPIEEKLICHCSGALSAEEGFPKLAETGAYGYAVHPLFPISDSKTAYLELSDAFFCLQGDETHLEELSAMLRGLGNPVCQIDVAHKTLYHAACTMASNQVIALVQQSIHMLGRCGFSEDDALRALTPLIRSNIRHLTEEGVTAALTGPVERNDCWTVEKHLNIISGFKERQLYRLLSQTLIEISRQKHPDRAYTEMERLLQGEET